MALSEKSRAVMFSSFAELLGEEAAQEMMSHFPARDVEEPVSKADLDALRVAIGADIDQLRSELREVRAELQSGLQEVRAELRAELGADVGQLRVEVATDVGALRADMYRLHNRLLVEVGVMIGIATTVLAVLR